MNATYLNVGDKVLVTKASKNDHMEVGCIGTVSAIDNLGVHVDFPPTPRLLALWAKIGAPSFKSVCICYSPKCVGKHIAKFIAPVPAKTTKSNLPAWMQ